MVPSEEFTASDIHRKFSGGEIATSNGIIMTSLIPAITSHCQSIEKMRAHDHCITIRRALEKSKEAFDLLIVKKFLRHEFGQEQCRYRWDGEKTWPKALQKILCEEKEDHRRLQALKLGYSPYGLRSKVSVLSEGQGCPSRGLRQLSLQNV